MNQETKLKISVCCDSGIIFAFSAMIFYLPISIALLDSFAAFIIFLYLIKRSISISYGWNIETGSSPVSRMLNRPIEILTLVTFISTLQSRVFILSLFAFVGKFIKGLFLYFIFIEIFINEKRIRIFLFFFLMGVFLVTLSGIVQHYTGKDFLRVHSLPGNRITSSFKQPNTFGAFLILPLGIVYHLLYAAAGKGKSQLLQISLAVLLYLLLVCLCWTYCRASWVGYLFSLLLMVWMDRSKIFYALCLLGIFICIFLPSLNTVRHISLFKDNVEKISVTVENQPSGHGIESKLLVPKRNILLSFLQNGGSGRVGFWKDAVFIIQKYPLWGTGLNTYATELKHFSLSYWYAHNCYLQMAAETGLIGVGCFLWMVFVFFNRGFNFLTSVPDGSWLKALAQGILAGLSGFLADSFFDNSLYTVQLGVLFWIMMGFAVAVMNLDKINGTFKKDLLSN